MQRNSKKETTFTTVLLMSALFAATRAEAQSQSPPAGASTPQCQAYSQAMQAAIQAGKAESPSAVQSQLMAQCLASQSSTSQGQDGAVPALTTLPAAVPVEPTLGPKKPGVTRIGVVQPKAQMGQGNSGVNVAEPIRSMISQYLNGPSHEIVPLSAMIPSQIDAEAKVKECDYVLYSAISQKIGGGATGLLKKAAPLSSVIPIAGMAGGVTGAVAGAAAGTATVAAASVASTVKAKSEVTLDYKLTAPGNATPVLTNTEKAKAKEDGEDVISPLIEHAATAIVAEVAKKK